MTGRAMAARSGETGTGSTEGNSAVANGDGPQIIEDFRMSTTEQAVTVAQGYAEAALREAISEVINHFPGKLHSEKIDAILRCFRLASVSSASAEPRKDTVAFVQEWMMSGDHEPDQWHRDFAAAIDARRPTEQSIFEAINEECGTDAAAWIIARIAASASPEPVPATNQAGEVAHPDDRAVDLFAARMKTKLAMAREKGRGGWDDPAQCSVPYLQQLLHEHVAKGDPVDVANFCMMLGHYDASTSPEPVPATNQAGEVRVEQALPAAESVDAVLAKLFPEWEIDQRQQIALDCAVAALATQPATSQEREQAGHRRPMVERAEHARKVLEVCSADRVGAMLAFSEAEAGLTSASFATNQAGDLIRRVASLVYRIEASGPIDDERTNIEHWKADARALAPDLRTALARAAHIAAYRGPVVSFDVTAPYYLASCDSCGWVGSSEHCGVDTGGDDSSVYCPRCEASGADCGKIATQTPPWTTATPTTPLLDDMPMCTNCLKRGVEQ